MSQASAPNRRELLIDFYRSCFMLFVFYHHTTLAFPGALDVFTKFNPFAELFVGISGFVVAYVFLHKQDHRRLVRRALQILAAYYVVAIPVSVGAAAVGDNQSSLVRAFLAAFAFQEDRTNIGILRFYGLIFLTLPWLLPFYRRRPWTVLLSSAVLFLIATNLYTGWLHRDDGFFVRYVLLVLCQWQFFFVVGLGLGDLYRRGELIGPTLWTVMAAVMALGLGLEWATGSLTHGDKFPYTFEKFLNLLWSLPTLLIALYGLYRVVRHTAVMPLVLVVGQHSLMAFIISEVFAQAVKLVSVTLGLHLPLEVRQLVGVLSGMLVIATLHAYVHVSERLARPRPASGLPPVRTPGSPRAGGH